MRVPLLLGTAVPRVEHTQTNLQQHQELVLTLPNLTPFLLQKVRRVTESHAYFLQHQAKTSAHWWLCSASLRMHCDGNIKPLDADESSAENPPACSPFTSLESAKLTRGRCSKWIRK